MQNVNNFSAGKIALASPDRIRLWSRGEVRKQARVVRARWSAIAKAQRRACELADRQAIRRGEVPLRVLLWVLQQEFPPPIPPSTETLPRYQGEFSNGNGRGRGQRNRSWRRPQSFLCGGRTPPSSAGL